MARRCSFLLLFIILVFLLAFECLPVLAATEFSDVAEGAWYYEPVMKAARLGIIHGYKDGSFRPDRTVSYGEFIKMAVRGNTAPGSDYPHWAAGCYSYGLEKGYFAESQINVRSLDNPIPRKYMALIVSGLIDKEGLDLGPVGFCSFRDVSPGDSFEYAIACCVKAGVLSGYTDGSFRPEGFLTRAEAASMFVRLDTLLKEGLPAEAAGVNGNSQSSSAGGGSGSGLSLQLAGPQEDEQSASALALMPAGHREILDGVLGSLSFYGDSGAYKAGWRQPFIPSDLHFSMRITLYEKTAEGTPTLFTYTSDEGWMGNPANYNSEAHSETVNIAGVNTIKGKALNCYMDISCGSRLSRYYLRRDYDGSVSLKVGYIDGSREAFQDMPLAREVFLWK